MTETPKVLLTPAAKKAAARLAGMGSRSKSARPMTDEARAAAYAAQNGTPRMTAAQSRRAAKKQRARS